MAQGVRDPGPVRSHIHPNKGTKGGGGPQGKDRCLTWINVCLSALGRFLAWRSASSHSFLTWRERDKREWRNTQGGSPVFKSRPTRGATYLPTAFFVCRFSKKCKGCLRRDPPFLSLSFSCSDVKNTSNRLFSGASITNCIARNEKLWNTNAN